eukprot:jgi/Mesen1/4953/ME000247S04233
MGGCSTPTSTGRASLLRVRAGASSSSSSSSGGPTKAGGRGKSVCRVNGVAVPLKVMRALGGLLVDVNGQSAQATLRTEAAQLRLLDRHAGTSGRRAQFEGLVERARALSREHSKLDSGGAQHEAALQQLVDEVEVLGLQEGESAALRLELRDQERAQAATDRCRRVHSLMSEKGTSGGSGGGVSSSRSGGHLSDPSLFGRLRAILRELQSLEEELEDEGASSGVSNSEGANGSARGAGRHSASEVGSAIALVAEAEKLLRDAGGCVELYASELEFSEQRIQELKQRLRQ